MKKYNIVITGSGGREHALYNKVKSGAFVNTVYVLPGNPGIENSLGGFSPVSAEFKEWCLHHSIDIIVPGPEKDLYDGISDVFADTAIYVFGPDRNAAMLEASKIFAKEFMLKYQIPTAECSIFKGDYDEATIYDEISGLKGNLVLKYDGLAAGKGVFVCSSEDEAREAFKQLTQQFGSHPPLLLEKKLPGVELSIIGITDGKSIFLLQPSQDHKRLLDGDNGPNTGGMGAYTPVPFCTKAILEKIKQQVVNPTLHGIINEGLNYRGFIYFGIMMTPDGDPMVLEYNARLGDPETEVILPALKNDFTEILIAALEGRLSDLTPEFNSGYFIDVVLASDGYPGKYRKGEIIALPGITKEGAEILHAGTERVNGVLQTSGGRVLHVVADGETLEEARKKAYNTVNEVHYTGKIFRTDIGYRSL